MRFLAPILVLAACTQRPPPARPEPVAPAPVAAATPAALDDAAAVAASHAFMTSIDQRDVAAFQAAIGPGFALFEAARITDAARFVKILSQGVEAKRPPRTRTCKDERVFRAAHAVTYIGLCTERVPASGDAAAEEWEGWNTVVLAREPDGWKVVHWGWQKGGADLEREMWNDTFKRSTRFNQEPNRHLVEMVKGRRPGTALDVAMGQGRNALYLASQGWKTTGVDFSTEGIRIAKENAAKRKLALETIEADVDKFDFGTAKWDLVTMIYAGDDAAWIERIKASLKPGGLFIVEYFHNDATSGTQMGGFDTGELAKLFTGWTIVKDEVVDDKADWALGRTKLVRFAAQKPRA